MPKQKHIDAANDLVQSDHNAGTPQALLARILALEEIADEKVAAPKVKPAKK